MKMNILKFASALPIAIAGVMALASPASASLTELKLHYVVGQFSNPPTMEMKFVNGAWKWNNKGPDFKIQAKIKARAVGEQISFLVLKNEAKDLTFWQSPQGYHAAKFESLETLTIGKVALKRYESDAANLCGVFGGDKKVVREMPEKTTLTASLGGSTQSVAADMPITLVCLAKTAPVNVVPTGLTLRLDPAQPKCGQPFKLVTEVRSNYPGTFQVQLERGDGEKQLHDVKTVQVAAGKSVGNWAKTYKYNKSFAINYRVRIVAQGTTTAWVPVKVSCGVGQTNGGPADLSN